MKKLTIAFLLLLTFVITSCEKNEVKNEVENNKTSLLVSDAIPRFESAEKLYQKIEFLSQIGENERRQYETANGYKSLLTSVYEVYEGIDMENLTSIDELENYVNEQPTFLALQTNLDNELEYHPNFSNNHYSLIANEDRLFIVGNLCFKVFDDGLISVLTSDMQILNEINEVSVLRVAPRDQISITDLNLKETDGRAACDHLLNEERTTNGNERTKILMGITIFRTENEFGFQDLVDLYGRIRPYKKILGIWYHTQRTIEGRLKGDGTFNNPALRNIGLNTYIAPTLEYSVFRNAGIININVEAYNEQITFIDSWGDTPSTDIVNLDCD